jgi:hypothetical protein
MEKPDDYESLVGPAERMGNHVLWSPAQLDTRQQIPDSQAIRAPSRSRDFEPLEAQINQTAAGGLPAKKARLADRGCGGEPLTPNRGKGSIDG